MDNIIIMELPVPKHRATITIEALIEAESYQLAVEKAKKMLELMPFKETWKIRLVN